MSSKRANHFVRNYNWQEINNLFAYDVKLPSRLSKRQQILRLYKNSLRRVFDLEVNEFHYRDFHSYANGCREVRKDFETLKQAKSIKEVEDMQDKYEGFIEETYQVFPLNRDNVAYEWRHQKGLIVYPAEEIEQDDFGYYSPDKLDLYPKPREFEFRDEFPMQEEDYSEYATSGWEEVNENEYTVTKDDSKKDQHVKSPDELKDYVQQLREKVSNSRRL